jgi:hypothetical protein
MPTIKKNTKPVTSTSTTPAAIPTVTAPAAAPPALPAAPPAAAPATPPPAAPATDPNAALEQYVQQTVAQLDTVEVGLGADPALTPAQKRHALKFRKGGENVVAQIGNLAQQQQLESPALNVDDMMATLGKAEALQPLSNRVAAFQKHVADVIFTSQSDSLSMAQQFYALLQRRALTDNELKVAMAPVVTFFARKPVPKAAGALTKPQKKATAKAVNTLKKNAPEMLQEGAGAAGQTQGAAGTASASAAAVAGAAAPAAAGGGGAAPVAAGNGTAPTTGVGHS